MEALLFFIHVKSLCICLCKKKKHLRKCLIYKGVSLKIEVRSGFEPL